MILQSRKKSREGMGTAVEKLLGLRPLVLRPSERNAMCLYCLEKGHLKKDRQKSKNSMSHRESGADNRSDMIFHKAKRKDSWNYRRYVTLEDPRMSAWT